MKRYAAFLLLLFTGGIFAQAKPGFKAIAFFTGKNDLAHVSYVKEANIWFAEKATENNFSYDSTDDWSKMTYDFLKQYNVVLFLDTRPEGPEQRAAFRKYMENGGAWMGFHFAAFAMKDSAYDANWDWYHNTFLGSGEYVSNTWRPTPAVLKVEKPGHPALKNLPATFTSAPNEWYRWSNDLRKNPDIEILLSIHPSSFPLGTGPKAHEIWHEGYYPVAWSNKKFRMAYINMGHNDMDYEGGTNKELSFTFDNSIQAGFVLETLLWLGRK